MIAALLERGGQAGAQGIANGEQLVQSDAHRVPKLMGGEKPLRDSDARASCACHSSLFADFADVESCLTRCRDGAEDDIRGVSVDMPSPYLQNFACLMPMNCPAYEQRGDILVCLS